MNTIERLENWWGGHKARSVEIEVDNGYGATCWTVQLWHEHGTTTANEVSFWDSPNLVENAKAQGCVFPKQVGDETFPGLEATINAAIDAFDQGVWKKPEPKKKRPWWKIWDNEL